MTTDDDVTRLRELVTDLRRELTALNDSNDRRYEQRFTDQATAVAAALAAQKDAVAAALRAAETAVAKAEAATTHRLDAANEFRGQLSDQASTFIPRQEVAARLTSLDEKIAAIARGFDEKILALAARMDAISSRLENSEGKGTGRREGWEVFLGAAGVFSIIATIVIEIVLRTRH